MNLQGMAKHPEFDMIKEELRKIQDIGMGVANDKDARDILTASIRLWRNVKVLEVGKN